MFSDSHNFKMKEKGPIFIGQDLTYKEKLINNIPLDVVLYLNGETLNKANFSEIDNIIQKKVISSKYLFDFCNEEIYDYNLYGNIKFEKKNILKQKNYKSNKKKNIKMKLIKDKMLENDDINKPLDFCLSNKSSMEVLKSLEEECYRDYWDWYSDTYCGWEYYEQN